MFVDRDPDRRVKHLEWRIRVFGAGAILAVVGLYFGSDVVIWAAIGVLTLGFLLRFVPSSEGTDEEDAEG